MLIDIISPFDRTEAAEAAPFPSSPTHALQPAAAAAPTLRSRLADTCIIALRGSLFLASSYLMTLGLPLAFFLLLAGGNPDALFGHVANLADRFVAADFDRRVVFLGQSKVLLLAMATLIVAVRLPRFIRDLDRDLSGEKV